MTLEYRIERVRDDNGNFLATCAQLSIVATFGETEAEARRHAIDANEAALASMIADGENIPPPDGTEGTKARLPLLTSLKVQL